MCCCFDSYGPLQTKTNISNCNNIPKLNSYRENPAAQCVPMCPMCRENPWQTVPRSPPYGLIVSWMCSFTLVLFKDVISISSDFPCQYFKHLPGHLYGFFSSYPEPSFLPCAHHTVDTLAHRSHTHVWLLGVEPFEELWNQCLSVRTIFHPL